jgi:HD-GYP domain-containing protein (c-di-GMP phosphodiesterase class II)
MERKRIETELNMSLEKLRRITNQIIMTIVRTVEIKDPYTAGHQKRVSDLACSIAECIELSKDQIECLKIAASMHDIGKISVPAEILSKPGALSAHELNLVRSHPEVGYNILKPVEFPWPIEMIVLQHHEKMNGSGYPNGILGKDILPEARILAVADVVEAMSSHRPYRAALGTDLALEEILKYRGILYDSEAVDACILVFARDKFKFKKYS